MNRETPNFYYTVGEKSKCDKPAKIITVMILDTVVVIRKDSDNLMVINGGGDAGMIEIYPGVNGRGTPPPIPPPNAYYLRKGSIEVQQQWRPS